MKNLNEVLLLGTLASEVSVKTIPSGKQVANARVLTVDGYDGKEFKSFHSVVAWGKQSEVLSLGQEGQAVLVKGRISTRSYEKDGAKVWVTEVVATDVILLGSAEQSGEAEEAPF